MKRRDTLLGLAALACAPLRVLAQSTTKLPRIALADTSIAPKDMAAGQPHWGMFIAELRRLGYVEGRSVVLERWSAGADSARYSELARKVVASRPDVIVIRGQTMALRMSEQTTSVPIVMVGTVPRHLRESLSRPGKNVTGLQTSALDQQIYAKQAEMLKAVMPAGARVAWIGPKAVWDNEIGAAARDGAKRVQLPMEPVILAEPINEASVRQAFGRVLEAKFGGVYVSPATELLVCRALIAELAVAARLPAISADAHFPEAGVLMSYGAAFDQLWRRAAHYADRILKGARAGELPIEQPGSIQLVINLKTAKAIGASIPGPLLARADRVIE